jgi:hypothetical protein
MKRLEALQLLGGLLVLVGLAVLLSYVRADGARGRRSRPALPRLGRLVLAVLLDGGSDDRPVLPEGRPAVSLIEGNECVSAEEGDDWDGWTLPTPWHIVVDIEGVSKWRPLDPDTRAGLESRILAIRLEVRRAYGVTLIDTAVTYLDKFVKPFEVSRPFTSTTRRGPVSRGFVVSEPAPTSGAPTPFAHPPRDTVVDRKRWDHGAEQ